MTETAVLAALIDQAPGLAAAVIVVILFLKAMEKRDKEWREFLEQERLSRQVEITRIMTVLDRLVDGCDTIHSDLRETRTFLGASLDAMQKARNKRTVKTT